MIIACALFMQNLEATVLTTALPAMALDFHSSVTEMSVALTAYLLGLAIFIPISGTLADRFGAKTVFLGAIAIFVTGSVACGLAPNLPAMVGARFFQAMGGAMMMPIGRLVLLRLVAKSDMVSAMSWLLMPAMIGPILGPPVGGFIITYLDWRWIFWLNVPMGALGMVLVARFIHDVRECVIRPFDLLGFLWSGVALGCLMAGLELALHPGAGRVVELLLAVGAGAAVLYLVHARRTEHPILDVSLMRIDTFRISLLGGSLTRITQGAQPFLLPLMMQLAFGLSAAGSGLITLGLGLGAFAMKGFAHRLLRRFGFRTSLIAVGVLAPAAYAVCGLFSPRWPMALIFAVVVTCGFLMSFQFTAYNTIAYDEVEPERMGAATSFYSTFQQLGHSVGVCAGAAALQVSMLLGDRPGPVFADFAYAFWAVNLVSMTAIFLNVRFHPAAGAELSGHGRVRSQ